MPGPCGAGRKEGGDKAVTIYFRYILKVRPAVFLEKLVLE